MKSGSSSCRLRAGLDCGRRCSEREAAVSSGLRWEAGAACLNVGPERGLACETGAVDIAGR